MSTRPSLPDLSIRQLEYLVAVADAPNWAAAAADVGVSPSALSQGLASWNGVGVPLSIVTGGGGCSAPAVTEVLLHARQVVGLTADLAAWAQRARGGGTGRLRLGMIDAAAIGHYPDMLRAFRVDNPDVDLRLTVGPSGQLLDELEATRLDAAVCVAPNWPRRAIATAPLRVEDIAVYSPSGTRPRRPAGWGPWVLFPDGSHTRELIDAALRELGAPLEVVAESHQPDVLRAMVRLGVGWTAPPVVQAEMGTDGLRNGRVVATRELVVATRQGVTPDPVLLRLIAELSHPLAARPARVVHAGLAFRGPLGQRDVVRSGSRSGSSRRRFRTIPGRRRRR
ncbi:MAG: LysR family transcriptional regulator substrate-binding protein [Acidimicrobiales bacterium]